MAAEFMTLLASITHLIDKPVDLMIKIHVVEIDALSPDGFPSSL